MHPYFYLLNKAPCFNLLDLLTSDLRQITGDTYKVCFEKVLTFIYASELFRSESGQNQRKPGVLRLLNFCPIITQSSMRLTIPVAFIYQPLLVFVFRSYCLQGEGKYTKRAERKKSADHSAEFF